MSYEKSVSQKVAVKTYGDYREIIARKDIDAVMIRPGVKPKTLQPGETIRCRYRVWIHRGAPNVERVSQAYRAYEESLRAGRKEK